MTQGRTTVVQIFGAMDRGGAEMRTLELIERVDREQVRSIFVTLSGCPGSLAGQFEAAGAEIVPIKLSGSFPMAFVWLLRSQKVDAVHSHVATFSGVILTLARVAGVRRRIAHFRSDSPPARPTARKRAQYRLMRALIGWAATDIVGVSPGALTYGWRSDWEGDPRCRVIPSGLDLGRFGDVADEGTLRELLGARPQDKLLVHIGRGIPLKNRERAISIFAELSRSRPMTWLAFVGADTPDDRAHWQQLADDLGVGERVRFLGERGDVPQLLRGADLLALTSHYEGLPGVVVEAAAAGTPILASDLPGVRFIAAQLRDVHLMSLQSPDAEWARKASFLLDAEPTPRSREAARQRMRGGVFDLTRAAPRFLELWTGNPPIEAQG
jgi:glycosyltransferase involved in cell wall biosynthesis